MKKVLSVILVCVIALSMGISAFALPSPENNGKISNAVDAEGAVITWEEVPVEEEVLEKIKNDEVLKEIGGDSYEEGMKVIVSSDIIVPEGTKFPITVTLIVYGVDENTKGFIAHVKADGTIEYVEATFSKNQVTASFDSLSPVFVVVDEVTATAVSQIYDLAGGAEDVPQSPQTGDNLMLMVSACALFALCVVKAVTKSTAKNH